MPEVFTTECTVCGFPINWTYERHVYENRIECPECEEYIEIDADNQDGE